jgi:hypothetical protein
MTEGHPITQHDDLLGNNYPDSYRDSRRNLGGGVAMGQGFGPYNGLAPGDSIHIVFAEGVDGLSWEKGREVGANWLQWHNGTGTPQLILPDGSTTVDANLYKRTWCETGKDNILQTYRNAKQNYDAGFNIPQPPPPPNEFTVTSSSNQILLEWSNNATTALHFGGYVIYRAEGSSLAWTSVYTKVFETNNPSLISYIDTTAKVGYDYYYYIQSKDDGTQNDIEPGVPLYSSMFWTMTSIPTSSGTDVESNLYGIPKEFKLRQNYPNPFNPLTKISFDLPKRSQVSLKIYDFLGREIVTLVKNEEMSVGSYTRQWNATNMTSGIYFYRLQAGSFTETKKLIFLK